MDGRLLYQVRRWEPKTFTQRRPNGNGGWVYEGVFDGVDRALIAEQDNAIPPAGQHWMAKRADATLGTVAASHAVMVSQPGAVTQTVLEAVESV